MPLPRPSLRPGLRWGRAIAAAFLSSCSFGALSLHAAPQVSSERLFSVSGHDYNSSLYNYSAVTRRGDRVFSTWISPDLKLMTGHWDRNHGLTATAIDIPDAPANLPADVGGLNGGIVDDVHRLPSLGVDRDGYVHVVGNHHNSNWQYWISKNPLDTAGGFDFYGGRSDQDNTPNNYDTGNIVGGNFITYPRFFYDRNGEMYVRYRQRARLDFSLSPGLTGAAVAKYNAENRTYDRLGGDPIQDAYPHKSLAWNLTGRGGPANAPETGWYQTYRTHVHFDADNTMHLVYVSYDEGTLSEGNPPFISDRGSGGTHAIYAKSYDGGQTFYHADGTPYDMSETGGFINHANADTIILDTDRGSLTSTSYLDTFADGRVIYSYQRGEIGLMQIFDPQLGVWQEPTVLPGITAAHRTRVIVGPDDILLATAFDGAYWSLDQGDTWSRLTELEPQSVDVSRFREAGELLFTYQDNSLGQFEVHRLTIAIPEPTTAGLLLIGLAGLAGCRRPFHP